jgi:hypothetical protein
MEDEKAKPNAQTLRHDATTQAATAIIDEQTARRDSKTARLKKARLAKAIEIEPEKPKRKR